MTIKELEQRSGMERANIRFYEKEGLFQPARLENGYRDYSEEDLQILLKIKLLRSLHISLEEIRALKNGEESLSDIMSKKLSQLDQEQRVLSFAQETCRLIKEERATFQTLDAEKYWNRVSAQKPNAGQDYFPAPEEMLPPVPGPFKRYFARMFDLFLYNTVLTILFGLLFHVNLFRYSPAISAVGAYISLFIMYFAEPLFLHRFGTTPGKALLGLHIHYENGSFLSYQEAKERTFGVISSGMFFHIPLISQFVLGRHFWRYHDLEKDYMPIWDYGASWHYTEKKPRLRWLISVRYIAAFALLLWAVLSAAFLQTLPPHRGQLTVAEFAENYNYYSSYYECDSNAYLDSHGSWQEQKKDEGTTYFDLFSTAKPDFQYEITDGVLTGLTFFVDFTDLTEPAGSYDTYIFLASLSLLKAQKSAGLYDNSDAYVENQLTKNQNRSFSFQRNGVLVDCLRTYQGCWNTGAWICPEEGAANSFYHMKVSIRLIN